MPQKKRFGDLKKMSDKNLCISGRCRAIEARPSFLPSFDRNIFLYLLLTWLGSKLHACHDLDCKFQYIKYIVNLFKWILLTEVLWYRKLTTGWNWQACLLSPVTKLNSVLPHSGQFSPTTRDIRTFGGGKLMLKHFLVELFLSSGTLTKVFKNNLRNFPLIQLFFQTIHI